VKGPALRRLAARAPYFHNVAAETLGQAVNFYDRRFDMRLNDDQKQALEASCARCSGGRRVTPRRR